MQVGEKKKLVIKYLKWYFAITTQTLRYKLSDYLINAIGALALLSLSATLTLRLGEGRDCRWGTGTIEINLAIGTFKIIRLIKFI